MDYASTRISPSGTTPKELCVENGRLVGKRVSEETTKSNTSAKNANNPPQDPH